MSNCSHCNSAKKIEFLTNIVLRNFNESIAHLPEPTKTSCKNVYRKKILQLIDEVK